MPKAKAKTSAQKKAPLPAKKQDEKASVKEPAQANNKRTRSSKVVPEPVTKKVKKNDNTSKTVKKTIEPPKKVDSKKETKLQEKNGKKNGQKAVVDKSKKEPIKIDDSKNDKKNKKNVANGVVALLPKLEAVKEETKNVVAIKKCKIFLLLQKFYYN